MRVWIELNIDMETDTILLLILCGFFFKYIQSRTSLLVRKFRYNFVPWYVIPVYLYYFTAVS
jgi:hypothetical protein